MAFLSPSARLMSLTPSSGPSRVNAFEDVDHAIDHLRAGEGSIRIRDADCLGIVLERGWKRRGRKGRAGHRCPDADTGRMAVGRIACRS